jgi:hypothetical protein
MITNKGQQLITKYMIGQASSYASHIAVGCGTTPYTANSSVSSSEIAKQRVKQNLNFEMFRVPITSRGYVTEESGSAAISGATIANGVVTYSTSTNSFVTGDRVTISGVSPAQFNISDAIIIDSSPTSFAINHAITGTYSSGGTAKTYYTDIVFSAELPTEERYEITELGLFSAQSNPDAGSYDSRTIYSFSQNENWQYHGTNIEPIPVVYSPLDPNEANVLEGTYTVNGQSKDCKVIHTNADNTLFANENRIRRYETCRYLNNIVAIRGNLSNLSYDSGTKRISYNSGDHIHLNNVSLNFDKNSPSDELRLAFSVINKRGSVEENPSEVNLIVEFAWSDGSVDTQYAKMEIHLSDSDVSFSNNRYFVVSKKLSELYTTSGFSWSQVTSIKVFASIKDSDASITDLFYIGLDALRIENISTINPLYGMSGYSIVRTTDGTTIKKLENTTNHIEFRFGVDM